MGRKKKFIDKKKSATFHLLARDSSDYPNFEIGTPSSSVDRVFVRVDTNPFPLSVFDYEKSHNDSRFDDAPGDEDEGDDGNMGFEELNRMGLKSSGEKVLTLLENVRREILELGFPDDGYNYLVHLREISNAGGGSAFYRNSKAKLDRLPLDVKAYDASRVQITELNDNPKEKSIYSVAAKTVGVRVQKASDPEVAALLDDSNLLRFGSDIEELEEDFIVQANVPEESKDVAADKELILVAEPKVVKEENKQSDFHVIHDTVAENGTTNGVGYCLPEVGECDVKSRFLSPLDEQFKSFEPNEYDSDRDNDRAGNLAEDYESLAHQLKDVFKDHVMDDLELAENSKAPADVIQRCVEYAEKYESEIEDKNVVIIQESSDESETWDCETIVSTYSNLDNHPGKIEAPEIARKKKLAQTVSTAFSATSPMIALKGKEKPPIDFLPRTRKATRAKEKGDRSLMTQPQKKKQHGQESIEEKKERKAAVKEERRGARRVKKEMKSLYKSEAQRAQKVAAISCPSSIRLM